MLTEHGLTGIFVQAFVQFCAILCNFCAIFCASMSTEHGLTEAELGGVCLGSRATSILAEHGLAVHGLTEARDLLGANGWVECGQTAL